jgi:serine protease Do
VLKVEVKRSIPHLRLGRSSDLMPGETVIAIGNPLGLQHTVTAGIISAIHRDMRIGDKIAYTDLIQTDASINPGNSGGPLLNVLGELIGINTAVRGDAQNIGFAIPVDRLSELLPEMLDIQRLRRVQFGMHFDNTRSTTGGVLVKKVDPGSPAAKAGVQPGDVINSIDKIPTPDFLEAFSVLHRERANKALYFETTGKDDHKSTVRIALEEIPKTDSATQMASFFGMTVREMGAEDLKRLAIRRPQGLVVTKVRTGSAAAKEGIEGGDVLTMFGGYPVTSLEGLGMLLEQVNKGDTIPMQILRVGPEKMIRAAVALKAT